MNPYAVGVLWFAAAALAVWFYLHSRLPFRRRVATLRFWTSVQPSSRPRLHQLREPWALLMQLLFLLLLIVAVANPHWGATSEGRRVVIVLDTSIWSQVRIPGESAWIDRVHEEAQRFLDGLPVSDQVLLMSADSEALPIMPFTTDRSALKRAIERARSSSGIADVPRTLEIAEAALTGAPRGVLVYVGPGMLDEEQAQDLDRFRNEMESVARTTERSQFLVRLVGGPAAIENRGITRLSLRRDAAQPDRWHLLTQLKNYSESECKVTLKLSVNGRPFVQRGIKLAPTELANVENDFVWDNGGSLQAEISPSDELDADNRATVNIPSFRPVRVALFAKDVPFAKNVANVLASNPFLHAERLLRESNQRDMPDVAIYQGMSLPTQPALNSIWFLSGDALRTSPLMRITKWNSQHPATRWIRTRDVIVRKSASLRVLSTDTVLAAAEGNPPIPLIVAREQNGHRLVIVGFNPLDTNFPLQSAFPLLIAGSIEWMTRQLEDVSDSFPVGEIDLPGPATRIIASSGVDVPFARNGPDVHLLATEPGLYRVIRSNGDSTVAVHTPLLPAQRLKPTSREAAPLESEPTPDSGLDLWRWLVALAIFALWLEWWLYYSSTRKRQLFEHNALGGEAGMQQLGPYPGPAQEHSETSNPRVFR